MKIKNETLIKATATTNIDVSKDGAFATGRCLPMHQSDMQEWCECGTLDGVPVKIYYMLTDEDGAQEDMSNVDWEEVFDRVDLDTCECDRIGINDDTLSVFCAKWGVEVVA